MADIMLPPYLYPDAESVEPVDRTSAVFRPEFAPGLVQRQEQSAPILKVSQRYSGMSASDRGALLASIRACKGRVNGIYATPLRYALRGSFPATELLSNNTFADGTTGWTKTPTITHTVSDRILRAARNEVTGNAHAIYPTSVVTVTQYAPHVVRYFASQGRGAFGSGLTVYDIVQGLRIGPTITAFGMITGVAVPLSTSMQPALLQENQQDVVAGDYINIALASLSRCALVDNGPNLLLRSDELDHAAWSAARVTVVADNAVAPDGTTTAEALQETATTGTHGVATAANITVSAAAQVDYCLGCAFRAGDRTWGLLRLFEMTGITSISAYFDLTGSGAVGTVAAGANWSHVRAFIVPVGNSWYACYVVGRKTNSATALNPEIMMSTGDGVASYLGSAGLGLWAWRATLAQSSVPTRLVQTTSAASTGSNQTGSALHLKGLPASVNGLLLTGDLVEVSTSYGSELKQVTAALNSDAAGLGYLQFEPALFRSPADNDPIIVQRPFGKFLLANNPKIGNRLGVYADIDLELEELYE